MFHIVRSRCSRGRPEILIPLDDVVAVELDEQAEKARIFVAGRAKAISVDWPSWRRICKRVAGNTFVLTDDADACAVWLEPGYVEEAVSDAKRVRIKLRGIQEQLHVAMELAELAARLNRMTGREEITVERVVAHVPG